MKTTIYCRVSTEDQENEGTILQTQLALPIARARTERAAERQANVKAGQPSYTCQRSSGVEQRFRKPPVVSSNLTVGYI